MPGIHKNMTMSFRPNEWEKALIEQRAELSGLLKKDFITRSCIYSNIVVVGKKENIERIVNELKSLQYVMKEIVGQLKSGDFFMSKESYREMKMDIFATAVTVVDILNGASYLFDSVSDVDNEHWKIDLEQELKQLDDALKNTEQGDF